MATPTLRTLLAAALGAAGLSAPAQAATWSAPVTVSQTPHTFVGPLIAAVAGNGATLAAWPWQDGTGPSAPVGAAAAGRPAGATFGPEHPAPKGLLDVKTYASTRTLALAMNVAPGRGVTGAQNQRITYTYGRADGSFATSHTLRTGPVLFLPKIAAAPSGLALVSWIEVTRSGSKTRRIVYAAERRGGRFGKPFVLSGTGRADTVAAAVGPRGDEAIVFVREGRVLARVRRAGHHWGSILELARATGPTQWQLSVAIDDFSRVRAIWRRHQFTQSGVPGRRALEGAVMAAGRFTWGAAQTIEPDGVSQPVLKPTGDQAWALAYVHETADGPRPAFRYALADAGFGDVRYAAPAQGGLRGVDISPVAGGGFVEAWIQPLPEGDGDGEARAAALPEDQSAFGPVETVSPPEAVHEVRVMTDPSTGQPVAVWTARPEGTGPGTPIAQIHSVVRTATRAG